MRVAIHDLYRRRTDHLEGDAYEVEAELARRWPEMCAEVDPDDGLQELLDHLDSSLQGFSFELQPADSFGRLGKVQPAPSFPALGVEDRRPTSLVTTERQLAIKHGISFNHAQAQRGVTRASQHPDAWEIGKERYADRAAVHRGSTVTAAYHSRTGPPHVLQNAYATAGALAPGRSTNGALATQQHENFHAMLDRVAVKHGEASRRLLVQRLWEELPPKYRERVDELQSRVRGAAREGHETEEKLARLLNYVNDPQERDRFHGGDSAVLRQAWAATFKRSLQIIRAAAARADESWLHPRVYEVSKGEVIQFPSPALRGATIHDPADWPSTAAFARDVLGAIGGEPEPTRGQSAAATLRAGPPALKPGDAVPPKAAAPGWGRLGERLAARTGRVVEHLGVDPKVGHHRYRVEWTSPDGSKELGEEYEHHLLQKGGEVEIPGGYRLSHHADPGRNEWSVSAHDAAGNHVGEAQFAATFREPREGEDQGHLVRDGLKGWQVDVHPDHRRRGIATAMYRRAAEAFGVPVREGDFQTPSGRAFRDSLAKMAIADIPPGRRTRQRAHQPGFVRHDYSHLLPEQHRQAGMRLVVDAAPSVRDRPPHLLASVLHPGEEFRGREDNAERGEVGRLTSEVSGGRLHVGASYVRHAQRRGGLGTALYEASMAHAHHVLGARGVSGNTHSTLASDVHRKLAEKHGLGYEAVPQIPDVFDDPEENRRRWEQKPAAPYDDKYADYDYALKSEMLDKREAPAPDPHAWDFSPGGPEEMLGLDPEVGEAFAAAAFLAGGSAPHPRDTRRWVRSSQDLEAAALSAFGLGDTEENRSALRAAARGLAASGQLSKAEELPQPQYREVLPLLPGSEGAAEAVKKAAAAGEVQQVRLGGKHSAGSAVAKVGGGPDLLLKPGSGPQSPAAGAREDPSSQSRREAAFYRLAGALGLEEWVPRAELLRVDGRETAAIELLPARDWKGASKVAKRDPGRFAAELERYRTHGILHRWAALDFVAGNPDRHNQNALVSRRGEFRLIDHGSAFAGAGFDPAHDGDSFVPFYLRPSAPGDFHRLPPQERLRHMLAAPPQVDRELLEWLAGLDPRRIGQVVLDAGIDPAHVLERLARLRALPSNASEAINRLWAAGG